MRDIERVSEGERSREGTTPAAIRFPSAEELSVDTSRRFLFALPAREVIGEGFGFLLDCGVMQVRCCVHSRFGASTPVHMTCLREGETTQDSETGRRARDRERSASKRERRATERREKEQRARQREDQRAREK